MPTRNCDKKPSAWRRDIDRSTAEYDDWFENTAKTVLQEQRDNAAKLAIATMRETRDLRDLSPKALQKHPASLYVLRQAVLPPLARARLVNFTGVNPSLVDRMEKRGTVGAVTPEVEGNLEALAEYLEPHLDPDLLPWLADDRKPTKRERDRALLLLGDRHARAMFDTEFRNAQEHRQKDRLRQYLKKRGLVEGDKSVPVAKLPAGTFVMGRNLVGKTATGGNQNLPTDCVIKPIKKSLPLVALEMKSAGDFVNPNKRRKEESSKHEALDRAYGKRAVMVLQLFGYFDEVYLEFEASAGLDWIWDHRLKDLAPYLGA